MLVDTSPSLIPSTAPDVSQSGKVFVPDSQYPRSVRGTMTPTTDLTVDLALPTSLRQRRIRTVDRVIGEMVDRMVMTGSTARAPSPVRPHLDTLPLWSHDLSSGDGDSLNDDGNESEASAKKLFGNIVNSPNLISSTPAVVMTRMANKKTTAQDSCGTQILFGTPDACNDKVAKNENVSNETYSGHEPVFLPASFEEPLNRVISSQRSLSDPMMENADAPLLESAVLPRRKFRSTPPDNNPIEDKRRRVSFAVQDRNMSSSTSPDTITPNQQSTGEMLAAIDKGQLEKKLFEGQRLRLVNVPSVVYSIPGSDKTARPSVSATVQNDPPKKAGSVLRRKEVVREANKSPVKASEAETELKEHSLADVVWARWKPLKPHCFVPADLLDRAGSSTRAQWHVRLHCEKDKNAPPIKVGTEGVDFFPVDVDSKPTVRLTKKPLLEGVSLEKWQNPRIVSLRMPSGDLIIVPSRHVYIDNSEQLKQVFGIHRSPIGKLLLEGMSFVLTCGTDKSEQEKRATLSRLIKQYGGTLTDSLTGSSSVLLATEPKRTFKYLMAIIRGVPRVAPTWLLDSIAQRCLLPVSNYSIDDTQSLNSDPLKDVQFALSGSNRFKNEFGQLVVALGGRIGGGGWELCQQSLGKNVMGKVGADRFVDCIMTNQLYYLFVSSKSQK